MACFIVCLTESEGSAVDQITPEQETKQLMRKIRKYVRLLNRKWAELNQRIHEWQHQLDDTMSVSIDNHIDNHLCIGQCE